MLPDTKSRMRGGWLAKKKGVSPQQQLWKAISSTAGFVGATMGDVEVVCSSTGDFAVQHAALERIGHALSLAGGRTQSTMHDYINKVSALRALAKENGLRLRPEHASHLVILMIAKYGLSSGAIRGYMTAMKMACTRLQGAEWSAKTESQLSD